MNAAARGWKRIGSSEYDNIPVKYKIDGGTSSAMMSEKIRMMAKQFRTCHGCQSNIVEKTYLHVLPLNISIVIFALRFVNPYIPEFWSS